MDGTTAAATMGGTTLSAGLADSQAQLSQAMGYSGDLGSDSIAHFKAAYQASGGGPTLAFLGFNPFQIVATGAFHELFWGAIIIFLGIAAIVSMQRALVVRYSMGVRAPLASIAQVYFRLLAGVLIISNLPLLYAVLMTVNFALCQGVQAMASQSMGALLQTGSMGTLNFAQARIESIRSAAARRAMALYPSGASRDEMTQIGVWYNAMANAINASLSAGQLPGQLPLLAPSWENASTPNDQVASYVGRNVVQNFGQIVADLGALPAGSGPLSIEFPAGSSTSLGLLSDALASDDQAAAQAIAMADTPSNNGVFESARQLYAKNVLADALSYLDTQLLPVVGASPTLAGRVEAWFSEKVEQAAAAAGGFMTQWRAAVDWLGRGIGVVLTRMVAFFFAAGVGVLIEVDLFVLVVAVPFWLLPATEDAFHGALRSLVSLTLVVPAYQFIMLFVDALMGLVLKYILFGPLATGGTGALGTAGGAAYMVAAALSVVGSAGDIVPLVMFCYLVAYLFLAIYMAIKTPKLLAVFMKGAGAAGLFLSNFSTGLIAGASAALATAAVAGGGGAMAGRILGAGHVGRAPGPSRSYARPNLGPIVASSMRTPAGAEAESAPPAPPQPVDRLSTGAPRGPAGALRTTAAFGLRTFVDCLQADSPAEGVSVAVRALDAHRKQNEKEAEARHKARVQAEKASAPSKRTSRRAGAAA
jgi:hypothetical protein